MRVTDPGSPPDNGGRNNAGGYKCAFGTNSDGSCVQPTHGGTSSNNPPSPPQILPISQHVLAYDVNGSATRLRADWAYLVGRYGQPSDIAKEASYWRLLCTQIDHDACQGGLRQSFGTMDSAYSNTGTTLLAGGILITGGVSGNGEEQGDAQSVGDLGVRSLNDPASMRGVTVQEFEALAQDAGLVRAPAPGSAFYGGDGAKYYNPANKLIQVMWEKGDPSASPGDVHQGMYIKYEFKAATGGHEVRIPGAGSPNPESGDYAPYPELLTSGFFGADAGTLDPLGSPEDGAGTEAGAAP